MTSPTSTASRRARACTAWRRAVATGLGVAVAGSVLTLTAPAAQAQTPQQRAAALTAQVASLQARAEQQVEAYDQAQGELGQVTAAAFAAEQAVTTAQAQDSVVRAAGATSARQLYEMGGPASLFTSVLSGGGSVFAVQTRLIAAHRVLADDQRAAVHSSAHADAAVAAQRRADALAAEQTALEQRVAASAAQVQQTLTVTQALLAGVNTQIAALVAADQAAAAARDQQAFAQHLAMAQHLVMAQADTGAYAAQLSSAPPASSPVAAAALAAAKALSGHPYQWGGTGPVGYDCSGMTGAAYAAAGVHLPRTAAQQYDAGPHVALADLEPGDLMFWADDPADPATIHHVAMYAGAGLMMSADHTGDVVRLQPVWWDGYAGATRPDTAAAAAVPGPVWMAGLGS